MQDKTTHVVNDVIDGRPVTVTYCNLYDCARAFTGAGGLPLPVSQGGLCPEGMMIRVGEKAYSQKSLRAVLPAAGDPPFPFSPFPVERTTWRDWRARHPETDVYEGDGAEEGKIPRAELRQTLHR